jgi:hypothetical protein
MGSAWAAKVPSGRVYLYAVACGHRLILGCPHNTGSSTVSALVCSPRLTALASHVTIYGWSTELPALRLMTIVRACIRASQGVPSGCHWVSPGTIILSRM